MSKPGASQFGEIHACYVVGANIASSPRQRCGAATEVWEAHFFLTLHIFFFFKFNLSFPNFESSDPTRRCPKWYGLRTFIRLCAAPSGATKDSVQLFFLTYAVALPNICKVDYRDEHVTCVDRVFFLQFQRHLIFSVVHKLQKLTSF